MLSGAATVLVALVICFLLLMPSPPVVDVVADQFAHLLAFSALAFPLSLVRARFAVLVFIGVCAYGAGIELLQPFFGRTAEGR